MALGVASFILCTRHGVAGERVARQQHGMISTLWGVIALVVTQASLDSVHDPLPRQLAKPSVGRKLRYSARCHASRHLIRGRSFNHPTSQVKKIFLFKRSRKLAT